MILDQMEATSTKMLQRYMKWAMVIKFGGDEIDPNGELEDKSKGYVFIKKCF